MELEPTKDEIFMLAAIEQARKALDIGEVPIGAVVVCRDRIIARGYNMVERLTDPTAHAEMQAITSATTKFGGKYLPECTIYVTVEPCVMCAGALAWSQIGRVVYGAADPKRGFSCLAGNILHPKTVITKGVLEQECGELVSSFFATLRR